MEKQVELLQAIEKKGKISPEQLAEIKKQSSASGISVDNILLDKKLVDPEELAQIKAEILNFPYKSLIGVKINNSNLDIIPFEVANNYKIICFEKKGEVINIGILDPDNLKAFEAVDFLAKESNVKAKYHLISEQSFDSAIKQYRTLKEEISTALKHKAEEEDRGVRKGKVEFEEMFKSAPIAKIVSVIMRHAVEGRASDIHIEPLPKETRVRYRIDGILHTSLILPKNIHGALIARIKVMANLKLDETRVPQDGRIREKVNDKEIDFRISILPLVDTEKVVMRILDVTRGAPKLEELGFMGKALEVMKENIKSPDGIFLVTGPTGSGKSTTIFSILDILNIEGVNISTLEDPVEYFIKGANQAQIRPEVGFTFATGLRSLLRQDPDIIMVGEIRDNETAELAVHAGLTGHFVLSTLHTNDALGAIPRLMDMKVEPFLLSSTLRIVAAQRLARKICEYCKKEAKIPENTMAKVKKTIDKIPPDVIKELVDGYNPGKLVFYIGEGCSRCANTGYSGRVAISEVLHINSKIKEIINEKSSSLTEEEVKKNQPFTTIVEDGVIKALKGLTSLEEVMRVIED